MPMRGHAHIPVSYPTVNSLIYFKKKKKKREISFVGADISYV